MTSIADVFVAVRPDTRNFSREATPGLSKAGEAGGRAFGGTFARESAGPLRSVIGTAKGLATGFAALAAFKFAGTLVQSASDLNETLNKTTVVFGSSSQSVINWSKNSATSFGLSKQAALAATSQFGDMFHQLGFTQQASAGLSEGLVKTAADLGSFHNVDPSDVLQRIGGAMRGEYDSLQQLIPNISAATVQQEALRETHKRSVNDLTAAEKATATLAIVQRDGANAANDFAETSGGLANQQRILSASLSNIKASLGAGLVPVLAKAASEVTGLIPKTIGFAHALGQVLAPAFGAAKAVGSFLGSLAGNRAIVETTLALGGFVLASKAIGSGVLGIGKVVGKFRELRVAVQGAGSVSAAASAALGGPLVIALTAAAVAVGYFAVKKAQAKQKVNEFTDALRADDGALGENTRALVAHGLQQDGSLAKARALGLNLQDVTDAALGQAPALDRVRSALNPLVLSQGALSAASAVLGENTGALTVEQQDAAAAQVGNSRAASSLIGTLTKQTGVVADARAQYSLESDALGKNTGASRVLAGAQKHLTAAVALTKAQVQGLIDKFTVLRTGALSQEQANEGLASAFADVSATAKDSTHTLSLNTAGGRAHRAVIVAATEAIDKQVTADFHANASTRGLTSATATASAALATNRDRLVTLAAKAGLSKTAADKLVASLLKTPKQLRTEVSAPGMAGVNAGAKTLQNTLSSLERTYRVNIDGRTLQVGANSAGRAAAGGPIHGPGTGTSDTAGLWALSNGEHVWTAKEVAKAGGHGAVTAMRRQFAGMATGGPVGGDPGRAVYGNQYTGRSVDGKVNLGLSGMGVAFGTIARLAKAFSGAVGGSVGGGSVAAFLSHHLGVPYSWGGGGIHGPSRGFAQGANTVGWDCSSFLQYGFWNALHKMIPRTARMQQAAARPSGPQPGALAFYGRPAHHVSLLTGGNRMLEEPHTGAFSRLVAARPATSYGVFDRGGLLPPGGLAHNLGSKPERVLNSRQTEAYDRLTAGVSIGTVVVQDRTDIDVLARRVEFLQRSGGF